MPPVLYGHINIFGAPGSGVSTLGRALAARLGYAFFDTDEYYWFTGDALPFRRKRNPEHRFELLSRDIATASNYVVAGALLGWGAPLLERMDAFIYRWLPATIRYTRIREREIARYGAARLAPGGDLCTVYEKFQTWASGYDRLPPERLRSKDAEMNWLKTKSVPVLYLEQDYSQEELLELALAFLCRSSLP